ncbi:MAG: SDR family oxidoreductase [Cyclobacteriaceae bacterium]
MKTENSSNKDYPVIVITGAASGIGQHMAKVYSGKKYKVVATDRNIDQLKIIFSENEHRILIEHDISLTESWKSVLERTLKEFGKVDYLLNIAAIIEPGFIFNTELSSIDRHMDINAKGTFYGMKIIGDQMVNQRSGHMINIASLAGVAPIYGISLYSASKYAVRGYSLAAAQELREKNIYCTVICPDLVDTPMLDQQLEYDKETALTFSGSKALSVVDIEKAVDRAMRTRQLEICVPESRGYTAKIANFLPQISFWLKSQLISKGRANRDRIKSDRAAK